MTWSESSIVILSHCHNLRCMTYKTKNQVINPCWIIRSKILKTGINDMVDRFMPIKVIMTVAKCCELCACSLLEIGKTIQNKNIKIKKNQIHLYGQKRIYQTVFRHSESKSGPFIGPTLIFYGADQQLATYHHYY